MTYKLSDLLPYTNDILLKTLPEKIRVLQLLEFICGSAQDAIQAFLDKKYNSFDAQVSENLCQIRAYQLVYMLDNYDAKDINNFCTNIKSLCNRCSALLDTYKAFNKKKPTYRPKSINKIINIEHMLHKNVLNIELPEFIYLLAQNYILSKYKIHKEGYRYSQINYDQICGTINTISKSFARKFIHRLQKNISEISCQFILKLARELKTTKEQLSLLKSLQTNDEIGRQVIASYEATKIILRHAFRAKKQIKIMITQINNNQEQSIAFFLKPSLLKNRYVLTEIKKNYQNDGLLSFVGLSHQHKTISYEKYINYFTKVGFENIILANMAQHPQYAGILLSDKKSNPYATVIKNQNDKYLSFVKQAEQQFLYHKNLAIKIGCDLKNSGLFLLTHVRCDNIILQKAIAEQKLSWWNKYWYRGLHSTIPVEGGI